MSIKTSVYKNEAKREYDISEEKRDEYRSISQNSRLAKIAAEKGLHRSVHPVNEPRFDPNLLMPKLKANGLKCLSLFSGGGGLDLGFDRAGYEHVSAYELIPVCGETLLKNRPDWQVYAGPEKGDVKKIKWQRYIGKVDIIHGGPPCQPFSIAGEQKGRDDERNMWGEFSEAINVIKPQAFIAENVLGLLNPKFDDFVKKYIFDELKEYSIIRFEMNAADYGVPQIRRRVFFIGFKNKIDFEDFKMPETTHDCSQFYTKKKGDESSPSIGHNREKTMGVREALGLPDIGIDNLAPTIRSAFTGKRNTTSILNSSAGQKSWGEIEVWANGVQANRESASRFAAKHDHFRLSVQDVGLLQGFPEEWEFVGAVYQILGQIGNSVCPPVAYHVAKNVAEALKD